MRSARHSTAFSRLCLLLTLCFVWSFAVAPCAVAAGTMRKTPSLTHHALEPRPFVSLAERLANTPYAGVFHSPALPVIKSPTQSGPSFLSKPPVLPVSLLDDVGQLAQPIAANDPVAWRQELTVHPLLSRVATLRLWLGEYALAHDRQPEAAGREFRAVEHLTGVSDPLHGLAAYDDARALFFAGAYRDADDAFHRLLMPKTRLLGYDARTCALWWRHASACAGYHQQRSDLGIPEPTRLDPLCGVAALASSLGRIGCPTDRKSLLAVCHVTGEGNDLFDLSVGARKLGASLHCVTADDRGLVSLPKPLIAHVERDHFVAVVRADSRGVAYLCSDCGPWPGGEVSLTWRQWHALEPDVYGVVDRPNGAWDRGLDALPAANGAAPSGDSLAVASQGDDSGVRVASASLRGLRVDRELALLPRLAGLRGHVFRDVTTGKGGGCDRSYDTLLCLVCAQCCPMDGGGAGGNGGPFQFGSPGGMRPMGASLGDPVNLATGAEEYAPPPDLTVYNPHGPAVVWGRSYNSLTETPTAAVSDFGQGWSTPYDAVVNVNAATPLPGALGGASPASVRPQIQNPTKHLVLADRSQLSFTSAAPTAANPHVTCLLTYNGHTSGIPFVLDWYYNSASSDLK